ncbi:hypothetical protein FRB99_008045, partial [Tulasnella sp. 403]
MSNRIVPATYRAIIDDVMSNIRDHFLEFGVDEQVLRTLQNKWEQKVVDSNVAEFEPGPPQAAPAVVPQQQLHPHPPPPVNGHQYSLAVPQQRVQPPNYASSSASASAPYGAPAIKPEPHDSPYTLPALPAPAPPQAMHRSMMLPAGAAPQPQLTQAQVQAFMQTPFTQQQLQAMAHQQQAHMARQQQQNMQQHAPQQKPTPTQLQQAAARLPQVEGPTYLPVPAQPSNVTLPRIPQLDGPSSTSSSSSSRSSASPPPQLPSHTVVAPPPASSSAPRAGDEEIGSDLDDDDSEGDDDEAGAGGHAADGAGPGDIVYCTYDKVQRVKNKWKCVLKDGIVSVNGKDYLFSKCTG